MRINSPYLPGVLWGWNPENTMEMRAVWIDECKGRKICPWNHAVLYYRAAHILKISLFPCLFFPRFCFNTASSLMQRHWIHFLTGGKLVVICQEIYLIVWLLKKADGLLSESFYAFKWGVAVIKRWLEFKQQWFPQNILEIITGLFDCPSNCTTLLPRNSSVLLIIIIATFFPLAMRQIDIIFRDRNIFIKQHEKRAHFTDQPQW